MQILPGTIWPTAAVKAPPASSGWLNVDGAAYSRTTYAALFEAITLTTTANITNGSTSISNIPDTSDMDAGMPIEGPGIPAGATIATVAGATAITISAAATATNLGATIRVLPHGRGDGTTTFNVPDWRGRSPIGCGQGSGLTMRKAGNKGGEETHVLTIGEMPNHNHIVNLRSDTGTGAGYANNNGNSDGSQTNFNSSYVGSDGAHNNMQPYYACHFIIKA